MRTISASEARQGFAELLESTREGPVMIERQKRGVAVVMSVEEYDRLLADAPAAGGKRGLPTNPALMQLYPAYPLEGGQTHWQAIQGARSAGVRKSSARGFVCRTESSAQKAPDGHAERQIA